MFSDVFRRKEDSTLTERELQLRQATRRRVTMIGASLLGLVVIGLVSARPAMNLGRGWQARRHAQKAFALIEQEKWGDARDEAMAAYQLRNAEPEAIRAVARLLSRAGQTDALPFWRELAARTELTRTDLRDEAGILLKARESDQAQTVIDRLLGNKDGGPQPTDWILAAQLALQDQDLERANDYVNKVFASNASSDAQQLQAVQVLQNISRAQSGNLDPIILRRLNGLAKGTSLASLEALTLLADYSLSAKPDTPSPSGLSNDEIVRSIQAHPLAKPQHKLLTFDLKIHDHPEERAALIQEAIDQWKTSDNGTLAVLAVWLNSLGEYQREVDTIPQERAMQTKELFSQYVDALGALGRWDEIRRLIESERFPLDPVIEHMYLARCFAQQGQANGAENNWRRALELAGGDANKLMVLADYAEKNKEYDVASAAYEGAAATAPKLRAAYQGRLRIAWQQGNTAKLQSVLADLLRLSPHDPAVVNDEAYARVLLLPAQGADPTKLASIEKIARDLVEREPNSFPHRTLLALAYLREGQPSEALRVYEKLNPTPQSLTSSALAVHAATLAANDHRADAEAEAKKIPLDKLLPEERALIANL